MFDQNICPKEGLLIETLKRICINVKKQEYQNAQVKVRNYDKITMVWKGNTLPKANIIEGI